MFGDRLCAARLKAELSQEKLAYEAGLDRTYISHLENDKKSLTLDLVFRLCQMMGIKASDLVREVE